MLAGLILLFTPQNLTNKFQFAFAHVFSRPLTIGRNITLSTRIEQPAGDAVSRREYNRLQNHLANVTAQRDQAYHKIEKLSGFAQKLPLEETRFALAYVLKGSNTSVTINCGADYHLAKGQFVLGDNSIIGTISQVGTHTAKVKLITDPTSRIAVNVANQDGILQGTGETSAKIPFIARKHKIKVGDPVFTAKKPGFSTVPWIIGKVGKCTTDDDNPLLWDITVEPVCEIATITDVAVIVMNAGE